MKRLKGVIVPVTTPFDEKDRVDTEALKRQITFLADKGVDAVYPCGTTGEMLLMSVEERKAVAQAAVEAAAGRVDVFIHTGAMTLQDTLELTKHAHEIGADGVGIVTPSYFKVSRQELIQWYAAAARSVPADFPIYLYAIPQLAGNDIAPDVADELARTYPNIVGIKYSYSDTSRIQELLDVNDGKFGVVVGNDKLFLPGLLMGCVGTVSGCAGPMPEYFVGIYQAYLKGDIKLAAQLQREAVNVVNRLYSGGRIEVFKAVLELRGIPGGHMRAPLADCGEEELAQLRQIFRPLIERAEQIGSCCAMDAEKGA